MVVLNVDHPDIEEFIWCKPRRRTSRRAARAGFDMSIDGEGFFSPVPEANNSCGDRHFMRASRRTASGADLPHYGSHRRAWRRAS